MAMWEKCNYSLDITVILYSVELDYWSKRSACMKIIRGESISWSRPVSNLVSHLLSEKLAPNKVMLVVVTAQLEPKNEVGVTTKCSGTHPTTTPPHRNVYGTSRQPRKLIFGMHPYVDQTRWNMEDDLNIFQMEDDLNFVLWKPRKLIFGLQHCFNPKR